MFNAVVAKRLLFDVEKLYHDQFFKAHPTLEPVDAYGRNHLLRLLGAGRVRTQWKEGWAKLTDLEIPRLAIFCAL